MYVVDHERGKVAVTDGTSLSGLKGEVQSLAEPVSSSVVDQAGRLWTLGAGTGDLVWFDGTERHVRRAVAEDSRDSELVVIDGQPALVDRTTRLVSTVGDDGGFRARSCLDIDPADRSVRVAGSDAGRRLLVVSGDDGVLRVSDLGSGECGAVVVDVADPGSDLGAPQESQGKVFVPDYTTGTVVIVDLESREVSRTGPLVVGGSQFELFERDGIVFYNDPGSERAGVVRVDGTFAEVEKYDAERPGAGVVPEAGRDQAPVPDQAAPGRGEGIDEGASGGEDQGGGPDQLDRPEDQPGGPDAGEDGSPSSQLGGDPSSEPVADPGLPGGPAEPRTPPPGGTGSPPPGGGGPGTGEIPAEIEIRGQVAGEIDEDVIFTAAPKDRDETLSNVSWEFGDGAQATGNPARHAYDRAGEFMITARGTLGTGADRHDVSAIARFQVLAPTEPLEARFDGPATAETGEQVSFVNRSTGATRYEWAFEGADRDTWAGSTPPPLVWDDAGEYRVSLVAHRGAERDEFSLLITVSDPPPGAPVVGNIAVPPGPYDTATDYTFSAELTANPMSDCQWTLDGIRADCNPSPLPGGGTRLSVTHRFANSGQKSIRLAVTGPGGVTTPPAVFITVDQLSHPTAVITVGGAEPEGSGWVVNDTTQVTFDGRGSLPDYDRYEWRDLDTGARATGPQWVTTLSAIADPHRIQLTVVSDRQGGVSDTATVSVRVVSTPVQVLPEAHVFAGPTLEDTLRATARDPFGPIVWLNMYGRVVGTCVDGNGAETPLDVDYTDSPLAMGAPQNFVIDPDGTIHYQTEFDWCPGGGTGGTISEFELWVEVQNDVGEVIESEHLLSL